MKRLGKYRWEATFYYGLDSWIFKVIRGPGKRWLLIHFGPWTFWLVTTAKGGPVNALDRNSGTAW